MSRIYAVTGTASGIGQATRELLESQGHRVVGIDLKDAEVEVDLSSAEARLSLPERVAKASGGSIDAVIAVAGVSALSSLTVKVNYFGARDTVELLRPLLAGSDAPRAAVVASFSALQENEPELVSALEAGDEEAAVALTEKMVEDGRAPLIYASTKRAIAEWVRRVSITSEYAGAGIPINAVGPGVIATPMVAEYLATPEGRAALLTGVPMPLNGPAEPIAVARLLSWLTSAENTHITGQTVFIDGGADVTVRGPHVFEGAKAIEWDLSGTGSVN